MEKETKKEGKLMVLNGIIRRIDDLGRLVIPKEIRRNMGLKDGDALEIDYNNGTVSIRKYNKSFEQCALDWYNGHQVEINSTDFYTKNEYTFCIVHFPYGPTRAGFAKCSKDDAWDFRIGRVAAYARAMGRNLNKMIGYEE